MQSSTCLRDNFLISMPHLSDDFFNQSLIYLCEHSDYGAMGLVLNRPLEFNLDKLLGYLDLPATQHAGDIPVYAGGPVERERGFILHRPLITPPEGGSRAVSDEIHLSSSLDMLALLSQHPPQDALIALGYAGWSPGQLEQEMADNAWLSCPANSDIIFNVPAGEKMQAAASQLGVNLHLLTSHAGHA